MFNWFRRKPEDSDSRSLLHSVISFAQNSATLTWQSLYGILNHEQMYSNNASNALKLSAVRCAIDIYTGMTAACPRRMYGLEVSTGVKNRLIATTDHPASRMFSHYFHPDLLSDDALNLIVHDMLMDGNCYFIRELDAQGRTSRGYYVHPSRIPRGNIWRATGDENLSVGRKATKGELIYRIETGISTRDEKREAMLLPRSMMIHLKGKVPDAEHHRAFGFIENALNSLELYNASEKFGRNFYTRGIATSLFLTTPNRLAPDVLKRLEANFEEDPNAPLESIFKTRILEQDLKPVQTGMPLSDLQFIETRAFSVEDVARGLNIPPALLHSYMGTRAGDADLAQAISLFVQTGIGPFLSRLASQMRAELLPLASQMLYCFEFETLYLYRNVIDKFAVALRNLFEIGMVDRIEGRALLGLHIDPTDAAANPRYVPVNLMTVEHSLHLEEGAELANDVTEASLVAAVIANKGIAELPEDGEPLERYTELENIAVEAAKEQAEAQAAAKAEAQPPSGKMDKSPSKKNIDKRIRNTVNAAFLNVIKGLQQYETRVLDQKKQTRPDDYDTAVTEFYAPDGKFATMLNEQITPWLSAYRGVRGRPRNLKTLVTDWLSSQKCPEGLHNELSRTQP